MKKNDLIALLIQLPDDIDITIQTCHYDGTLDVYEDQEPKFIVSNDYAILTGISDIYAQINAVDSLSYLHRSEAVRLLQPITHIVKVD